MIIFRVRVGPPSHVLPAVYRHHVLGHIRFQRVAMTGFDLLANQEALKPVPLSPVRPIAARVLIVALVRQPARETNVVVLGRAAFRHVKAAVFFCRHFFNAGFKSFGFNRTDPLNVLDVGLGGRG